MWFSVFKLVPFFRSLQFFIKAFWFILWSVLDVGMVQNRIEYEIKKSVATVEKSCQQRWWRVVLSHDVRFFTNEVKLPFLMQWQSDVWNLFDKHVLLKINFVLLDFFDSLLCTKQPCYINALFLFAYRWVHECVLFAYLKIVIQSLLTLC